MIRMKSILASCLALSMASCCMFQSKRVEPSPPLIQPQAPKKEQSATPSLNNGRNKEHEADKTHENAAGQINNAGVAADRTTATLTKAKSDLAALKSKPGPFAASDWLPVEYDIDQGLQDLHDTQVALEAAKLAMDQEKAMRAAADRDLEDALNMATAKDHEAETLRSQLELAQKTADSATKQANANAKAANDNASAVDQLKGQIQIKNKIMTWEGIGIVVLLLVIVVLVKL